MTAGAMTAFAARKAAQVTLHFDLSDEAKPLLKDDDRPADFLELLIGNSHYIDAIRFMAHAMPKREAVWWACLCVRSVECCQKQPADQKLVELTEKWVVKSTEDNRRAAMTAAEKANYETPAAWTATAAAWSGGSLAPPDLPAVPPGEHLCAQAVIAACLTAAGHGPLPDFNGRLNTFVNLGLEVAKGAKRWPGA